MSETARLTSRQNFSNAFEFVGQPIVIRIQVTDQISFRSVKATVKCCGLPGVVLPDVAYHWKGRHDLRRLIGGTVIDDYNLIGRLRLPQNTLQALWEKPGV